VTAELSIGVGMKMPVPGTSPEPLVMTPLAAMIDTTFVVAVDGFIIGNSTVLSLTGAGEKIIADDGTLVIVFISKRNIGGPTSGK
jgi:hypothetical protein